ncbi:MAG: hypothetical protein ACK5AV_02815 [Alphaproteobacteria bacterium]
MATKNTSNLKAELLGIKGEAINAYNDYIYKQIDLVQSINNNNFDGLFQLFSKEELAQLSEQAKSAENSWFSGWQNKMISDSLENTISVKLASAPQWIGQQLVNTGNLKLVDYFDLDSYGVIKYEDLQAHKDDFAVLDDLQNIGSRGSVSNHVVIIDHKMIDGTETHLEAKFDTEKFGEWIKYNLVEEHYLDHVDV